MVRKLRGIKEAAVVEMAAQVGVRTRAREATVVTASKRRKLDNASSPSKFSPSSSTPPNVELRSQSVVLLAETEDRCATHPSSGASCCSSNGSSERTIEFEDLEDEGGDVETSTYYCITERKETMPSGQDRRESKTPTESELEEFFAGSEKQIQKRFADKYNYDIAKDEPLEEGRYEWVRLKP